MQRRDASAKKGTMPATHRRAANPRSERRHLWQECTAGDPRRAGVLGTNLSLRALSRSMLALGTPASERTIRRLLRTLHIAPCGRTLKP